MSRDRHRGASHPEFQPTDRARSNSDDRFHNVRHNGSRSLPSSSSISTAHRRVFSIANSHTTNTDESALSIESNTDSLDHVLLRVYREQATNSPMLLCHRRDVTPSFLRSFSVKLVQDGRRERVDNEDCLIFEVSSAVNAKAFRLMVENIGKVPRVIPSRTHQSPDISFMEFFELCIVLWSHVCRIDHWVPVAEHIRDTHWEDDLMQWPAGRLTQWLFIALVFDWPSIFETASTALIMDFSGLDAELLKADYLPHEVVGIMTNTRREYMRKTYDEIRGILLSLNYDYGSRLLSLPHEITAGLIQAPLYLDLRQSLPEDIHKRVSPSEVLKRMRETIERAHSVPEAPAPVQRQYQHHTTAEITAQPSTPSSVHSDNISSNNNTNQKSVQRTLTELSKTTRTAEGGDALFDVMRDMWRSGKDGWRRRHVDNKKKATTSSSSSNLNGPPQQHQGPTVVASPPPLTRQDIDGICETLLGQLMEFETTQLRPLNIDHLALLRSQHVLSTPAAS